MEKIEDQNVMRSVINDEEFVAEFMDRMQLITQKTGVELVIDISQPQIAWMIPGDTHVFFNPLHTLSNIEAIQKKREEEFGISENFTFNVNHLSQILLHEIDHMINHTDLKMSDKEIKIDGKTLNMVEYEKYLYKKYGEEFAEFNNLLEDIDVNNHATKIQAPVFKGALQDIYHHIAMPSNDFSNCPLAKQFGLAILRESMLPEEKCIIDPRVRDCIDYLSKPGEALEKIRNPKLKFDEQLPIIHRLFEEYYLKLKEEDKKDKESKKDEETKKNEESKKEQNEGGDDSGEKNKINEILGKIIDELWQLFGGKKRKDKDENIPRYTPGEPMLIPHIFEGLDGSGNNILEQILIMLVGKKGTNPKNRKDKQKSGGIYVEQPNNSSSEQIRDAIESAILVTLQQRQEDQNKSPEERNLEALIQQERNINPSNKGSMRDIKNAIKRQEYLKEEIKQIKDSKGQSVYDKITKDIFSRIVQTRKRNRLGERHNRPFSEGGQLDPQNLVNGIIDWKTGDDDPHILQQEYKDQKEKQKAGGFSITLILDGSGSMSGIKNEQQTLSTLLMLYSLQQLNQDIKLEGGDMEDFLISTQVMMFRGSGDVALLKNRGKELNMKDVIDVTNELGYCNGGDTNAVDAIDEYYDQISKPFGGMSQQQYDERRLKVKDGKFKEIVFVLSDGGFHGDPSYKIKKLREMGVIVCGIGITSGGAYITNYFGNKSENEEKNKQGFGIVCKDAGNLGNTLNELLVEHLEDPSIIG